MARPRADRELMPSLLDRLTDGAGTGAGLIRGYTPALMMDAVRLDLEALFNTHDPSGSIPPEYAELRASVASFGLPELGSLSASIEANRAEIAGLIETIIARHEPRLRNVRVRVMTPGGADEPPQVRFQIEAQLDVDPSPEVEFETVVELATGQATIRRDDGG